MAAGTLKSVQETNRTATPPVMQSPQDGYGKVRRLFFNYVNAGGDYDAGSTIDLCRIPAGCRIMGGVINVDAGFADANATADIGDGTTAAKYLNDGDIAAAGAVSFGHTLALNYGEAITAAFTLKLTTATAVLLAAGIIKGHVDILVE